MPNPQVTPAETCTALLATATKDKTKVPDLKAAAVAFGEAITLPVVGEIKLFELLKGHLDAPGKQGAAARQGACYVLDQVVAKFGKHVEHLTLPLLATVLSLVGDKLKPVRDAGEATATLIFNSTSKFCADALVKQLMTKTDTWQPRELQLKMIAQMCESHKEQMMHCMPEVIPSVAEMVHDIKSEVATAARATLVALCGCCTNVDIVPTVPNVVAALEDASNVSDCVARLASTTFVEIVDSASLSVICPILRSGLGGRDAKVKRGCARIVDNMTTLVEDSRDVLPFVSQLLPQLEAAAENIPNPEYRTVCAKAVETLKAKAATAPAYVMVTMEDVLPAVLKAAGKVADTKTAELTYAAGIMCMLNQTGKGSKDMMVKELKPYLAAASDDKAADAMVDVLVESCSREVEEEVEEIKEDAEELCNCDFSLAYGNKVLLKKTKLVLHRGLRYGLIGKNDSGKTSLMRAIAEYRVEGFPDASELRTIFVETDIKAEFADMNIVEYLYADPLLASLKLTRDQVLEALKGFGFVEGAPATPDNSVGTLSGGWRMKLALARAMMLNADILLLDEPTNHMDTYNVKWVEDFLQSQDRVTSIMVSHDSGLLDRVCTNIISIDSYKLKFYKGNISAFVAKNPDAKAFFELKTDKFAFHFPVPGPLSGVTSKGKAIMKMDNISFTYPTASKPQLKNVSVAVSLGSRVACVGVNGAGKSTMIKLLTGELEPDEGSGKIWQHPNLRVGYIAQHAFHHIDKHLDSTANDYVKWRYANGNDREEERKVTAIISEEEQKKMDAPIVVTSVNPETGQITKANIKIGRLTEGRRTNKQKNDQEYECTLKDSPGNMIWLLRKELLKAGWEKVVNMTDQRIATRAAMYASPLTTENVRKHFEQVGLEEEFSTHVRMASLSGGQKVKVVLGAAMWNKPHILILDEPTNYLDRDSLGALAQAIREFEGGVVMITHNSQFCDNLCPVVWHLQNNTLDIKGDAEWMREMGMTEVTTETVDKDKMVDAHGNTITLEKNYDDLSNKDKKKREKALAKYNKDRKKKGLEAIDMEEYNEIMGDDF